MKYKKNHYFLYSPEFMKDSFNMAGKQDLLKIPKKTHMQ